MEYEMGWLFFTFVAGAVVGVLGFLKRVNEWRYVSWGLGTAKKNHIPPGDMGWPLIGNLWAFLRAFRPGGNPDLFISNLDSRFGSSQLYKTYLFGSPTIIATTADTCKRVLMDDDNFGPGWPKSVYKLMGRKGFHGISTEEHKRLRKLTASSIKGHEALSLYIDYIQRIAETSFDELARKDRPVEFLTEMRKIGFRVTMHIIMSSEIDDRLLEIIEREFGMLSNGLKAMTVNLPGFAHHKALKARKTLLKIFETVVEKRREMKKSNKEKAKKDMLDLMIETEGEDGRKLSDEEIVDLMIMYLFAGHESSAHATTWALVFLQQNPQFWQKAREEQEQIIKGRSSSGTGLSLGEIRNMKYLSKVIDETLRVANLSYALFREAKTDVIINGFLIPKGWKVLPWLRNIHVNSSIYPNPKEFNPSRWDDYTIRSGTFVPFGAGSRLCPGADLAKLEISIFLHYFLLNYKMERVNPNCGVKYLPITKPRDNCLARIKKLST